MTAHLAVEEIARQVPREWSVVPFRRVAQERGVRNVDLSEPSLSLSSAGALYERTDETDRQFASEQSSRNAWVVHPGDLVVNPMWLFGGAIGVSEQRGAVSPDYRVYRLSRSICPRFLHHLLRSPAYRDQYRLYMRAETTFDRRITKDDFGEMPLIIPPESVQRDIADYLDREIARIDGLIEARRAALILHEELFRSQRASLVLRGLNPVSGAGGIPNGWTKPLLGVLIELHRGLDLPAEVREDGNVPVVSSGGVSGSHSVAACDGPGVVTGRYGTVGEVFYVDGPYWPLNTTLYVSDFRRNEPKWVYHLLATMPLAIDADKSAVTGINRNVVGQLRAVRPPIAEQRLIAVDLDRRRHRVEETAGIIEHQITLLMERRQALITAAVTGQIEIPGVAA